jgi:hypothetical protein
MGCFKNKVPNNNNNNNNSNSNNYFSIYPCVHLSHVQSQKEPLSRDAPLVQFIKVWIMEKHALGGLGMFDFNGDPYKWSPLMFFMAT